MIRLKKVTLTIALFGLILTNGTAVNAFAADKIISKEAAKDEAFKKAGITKEQAKSVEVKYDSDDDEYGQIYEVEFKANGYKYSYEIDANDGTVLKSEKKKLKTKKKDANSSKYIGEEAAKALALKHAKLTVEKVTFIKAKLTTDDGIKIYDVEFHTVDTEYDYEINAKTGKIIEFSSEPVDDDD